MSAVDHVAEIATEALEADARLDRADSLYLREAEIVAQGHRRIAPPRYAGISPGGQVVVSSTRVDLTGTVAWALIEYRWLAPNQNLLREGRATLILVMGTDRHWRIVHAHSSTAE